MRQGGSLRTSRHFPSFFWCWVSVGVDPRRVLGSHATRPGGVLEPWLLPPPGPRGVGPIGVGTPRVVSSSSIPGGGVGKPSPLCKVL